MQPTWKVISTFRYDYGILYYMQISTMIQIEMGNNLIITKSIQTPKSTGIPNFHKQ